MRSDLTTRALIRDAALELFAEHGPDAVGVRQVAQQAQVSPALVFHHYRSKAGLREAVDAYAERAFDDLFDLGNSEQLAQQLVAAGDTVSIAEAFSASFPSDSPLPAYLRRLLLSGDPVGERLFRQWYAATLEMLGAMRKAGFAAASDDPEVRAAFLLANDLALILLRRPIEAAIGTDPMVGTGLTRWAAEASTVYRDGVWAPLGEGPEPDSKDGGSTHE